MVTEPFQRFRRLIMRPMFLKTNSSPSAICPPRQRKGDSTSRVLKTLSFPIRLKIVKSLLSDEMTVRELQKKHRCAQYRMSRHLAAMRSAGVVECRVEGPERVYYIPRKLRKVSQGQVILDLGYCRFRRERL